MFSTWEGPPWRSDFPLLWVFPAHPVQLGQAGSAHQAGTAAALQVFFQLLSPWMEGTGLAPVTLESTDSSNYFSRCSEYPPHSSTSPSQLRPAPGAHGTPGADVRAQTQRASEPPAAQTRAAPEPCVWGTRWLQKIHQDSAGVSSAQRAHGKQQRSHGASSQSKAAGAPPRSPVPGFPRVSKDLKNVFCLRFTINFCCCCSIIQKLLRLQDELYFIALEQVSMWQTRSDLSLKVEHRN